MEEKETTRKEEIFSNAVRAGRRTYFFDVKQTRKGDLYLTMTESKKVFDKEGTFHFEKHKLFLYKEDFEKFSEAFTQSIDYIHENVEESIKSGGGELEYHEEKIVDQPKKVVVDADVSEFTNVDFEDLSKPE